MLRPFVCLASPHFNPNAPEGPDAGVTIRYEQACRPVLFLQDSTICELQGSLQRAVGLHSQAERCLLVSQETQYSLQKSRDGALHELRESGKVCASTLLLFLSLLQCRCISLCFVQ